MFINLFHVGTFWGSTPVLTWCPLDWTKKITMKAIISFFFFICFYI